MRGYASVLESNKQNAINKNVHAAGEYMYHAAPGLATMQSTPAQHVTDGHLTPELRTYLSCYRCRKAVLESKAPLE